MYSLTDPVNKVKGIGPKTKHNLAEKGIFTVADLLLYLPLRYDDRSQLVTCSQLQVGHTQTLEAKVIKTNEYFNNRRRITSAIVQDETGQAKCIWFNNRYIKSRLKVGDSFFFSGKFTKYRTLTQPAVEPIRQDTIHTGRLVPLYSVSLKIPQGTLRRILKEVVDNLDVSGDKLADQFQLLPLGSALKQLHFPKEEEKVRLARKRLALEELLSLMKESQQIKKSWQKQENAVNLNLKLPKNTNQPSPQSKKSLASAKDWVDLIPDTIPFTLTQDQLQATTEILADMNSRTPMNRLLIGDVGTGKTVVAGIACHHTLQSGHHACLIAPTQILAKQHAATFQQVFPNLPLVLLTADTVSSKQAIDHSQPQLFIGTHAVINRLETIEPALIIYDEQHRFGVKQRSKGLKNNTSDSKHKEVKVESNTPQPHLLTMTATPIPRSFMLTVFAHLEASIINQSPFGPKPIKTWLVPSSKKQDAYHWVAAQLSQTKKATKKNKKQSADQSKLSQAQANEQPLALVVCPFINPSDHEAFANIASATEVYQQLKSDLKKQNLTIALLHGQQKKETKQRTIDQLFKQEINLLITTSIVEVGVDLPQAKYMIIENADRFGLASLHQLRGRVGRQGQKSFCLLFTQAASTASKRRLKQFAKINNGLKLAELDLENRGGGDLFGLKQHGFDDLRFASWSNAKLIAQARSIFQKIDPEKTDLFFSRHKSKRVLPAAN